MGNKTSLRQGKAALLAVAVLGFAATQAEAGYINLGTGPSSGEFTFLGTPSAWDPGPGTARFGGFPAPGGATWSVMAAALGAEGGGGHAFPSTSVAAILATVPGGVDAVLNLWAAASGFSNLGVVGDGGGAAGAVGASGLLGDIRIGAYDFDGPSGVLAHAYQPGNEVIFGAGGSVAGDVHFDNAEIWSDAGAGFDTFTVLLHELGHALGLGHSADPTAVMFAFYGGVLRTLGADDIAGIQAIYGPAPPTTVIPEPSSIALLGLGLLGLVGVRARRRKQVAIKTEA